MKLNLNTFHQMRNLIKTALATALLIVCTNTVDAQSTQLFAPADSIIRIELRYLHPFYKQVENQGLLSGIYDFSFSHPLKNNWNLNFSLPLLFAKYDREEDYYFDTSSSTLNTNAVGNIMIGVNKNNQLKNNRLISLYLQLYLPTSPKDYDEASEYALYANLYDAQKYLGNVTTFLTKIAYQTRPQTGWFYSIQGGFQYHYNFDFADNRDLYLNYGLTGGYIANNITFSSEYMGIINLTNSIFPDFRDRMFDSFAFGIHYNTGNFNPSLFYSFYTREDIRDFMSGTLGIKLAYRFAK